MPRWSQRATSPAANTPGAGARPGVTHDPIAQREAGVGEPRDIGDGADGDEHGIGVHLGAVVEAEDAIDPGAYLVDTPRSEDSNSVGAVQVEQPRGDRRFEPPGEQVRSRFDDGHLDIE